MIAKGPFGLEELVLVANCLKGNREAQKQLYERYAPKMLGVCYRYAHTREEAEDFLQETFITVFRKLGQYRNEGSLEGWIHRITIRTSLNCIKARYPLDESLDAIQAEKMNWQSDTNDVHDEKDLISLVRSLPDGYRTVFNLYAIEGYAHEEIGKLLGIKAASSRSQYTRAREMLMKKLGSDYPKTEKNSNNG